MAYLDDYLKEQLEAMNKSLANRLHLITRMNKKLHKVEREMLQPVIDLHSELEELIKSREAETPNKESVLPISDVRQQCEMFVSFARFVHNYGKGSYVTAYEDLFKEWCDKRNV